MGTLKTQSFWAGSADVRADIRADVPTQKLSGSFPHRSERRKIKSFTRTYMTPNALTSMTQGGLRKFMQENFGLIFRFLLVQELMSFRVWLPFVSPSRDRKTHDSQRRDRILRFFPPQFAPHFISKLQKTLEKEEKSTGKYYQKSSGENSPKLQISVPCRGLTCPDLRPPTSPGELALLPVPENPFPVGSRTYYFYRISCINPLFSSHWKIGAKGDASNRCMF